MAICDDPFSFTFIDHDEHFFRKI